MNDEPQHKHRKYWLLCIFAVFIAILGVILPETEFTPKQYINASNITVVGATIISGSVINLSDINNGYVNISESTTPFHVDINFSNVTHFSFPEIKARYFSTTGTPSTHVVDLEIWCEMDQAFDDLKDLDNHEDWQYFTRHIPDYSHFIRPDGNVTIRLNHTANGNVNHRLYIDTARLITSVQYEQINTVLNQYFNTTTIGGGGGGVSFDGNPVNLNGSNMFNGTISNYSTLNYVNSTFAKITNEITYYVGKNGSDSNDCITSWCLTISKPLELLSEKPILNGSVTIKVDNGSYNEHIEIPLLMYGGYNLTIEGTLIEILNTTATGGNNFDAGNKILANAVKTGAGWTTDAYKDKLLKSKKGSSYYPVGAIIRQPIVENNATEIRYINSNLWFTTFSNNDELVVEDWNTSIVGIISNDTRVCSICVPPNAKVTFKNLNISNYNARVMYVEMADLIFENNKCTLGNPCLYAMYASKVFSFGNVFNESSGAIPTRMEFGSVYDNRLKSTNIYRLNGNTPYVYYAISGGSYLTYWEYIDGTLGTNANKQGTRSESNAFITTLFVWFKNLTAAAQNTGAAAYTNTISPILENTPLSTKFINIVNDNVTLGTSSGTLTLNSTDGVYIQGLEGVGTVITQADSNGKWWVNRTAGAGIPITSPDGTVRCLRVSNTGVLTANAGAC